MTTPKHTNVILLGILSLSVMSLSGCSGIPVTQDYTPKTAFVNYQSYQWLPVPSQPENGAAKLKRAQPFLAQRIEKAITNHLTQNGAKLVRYKPEAFISYGYTTKRYESIEPTTTIGVGFGGRHIGFGGLFPIGYETNVEEDATWTVDIYNLKRELVWRGKADRSVQTFSSPTKAEEYTQKVISAILSQYPPKEN